MFFAFLHYFVYYFMINIFLHFKDRIFLIIFLKTINDWLQNKKISGGFTENP